MPLSVSRNIRVSDRQGKFLLGRHLFPRMIRYKRLKLSLISIREFYTG